MRFLRSAAPLAPTGRARIHRPLAAGVALAAGAVGLWALVGAAADDAREINSGAIESVATGDESTRYVSCTGHDGADGRSTETALRSVAAVNRLSLAPGDRVLFQRGCAWTETLQAKWSGTEAAPITIGAYGTGARPLFTNTGPQAAGGYRLSIVVTGSFQVFDALATALAHPPQSPCGGNTLGWFTGFAISPGPTAGETADHNVLRNVSVRGYTTGVHVDRGADYNVIEQSELVGNGGMSVLTDDGPGVDPDNGDDIGAWAVLLNGSHNEIRANRFESNMAVCGYDTMPQGNAVEIYEGSYNRITHNVSINDQTFSELGSSPRQAATGNEYLYNVVRSSVPDPDFIVVRGVESGWGPNPATVVAHNTVYYTGKDSSGVVCHSRCGPDILTMEGNVLWVQGKALFTDRPFAESNNIYWNATGTPHVQFLSGTMSTTSRVVNPQFLSIPLNRFELGLDSPGIDAAVRAYATADVVGAPVGPDRADLGAFEANHDRVVRWRTEGVDIIGPDTQLPHPG